MQQRYKVRFAQSMSAESLNICTDSKDSVFMQSSICLMEKNYNDIEFDVDRFVKKMGYSKTLINNKLKELTGQSIGQFMRNFRLNVAYNTLVNMKENREINICDIACEVGFNDPKYFSKCFKEFYGMKPSEVRNKPVIDTQSV